MKSIFVTATDTEVGKTTIASGLIAALSTNYNVAGFKPIAAGCEWQAGQLKNEDALSLMRAANCQFEYSQVNPIALEAPIAPHIAAKHTQYDLCIEKLNQYYACWQNSQLDYLIVEGAGGWQLPLNATEYLSEWVVSHNMPIILVVGIKLGCINHALLTTQVIQQMGGKVIGWVANQVDPNMKNANENIQSLTERLNFPCLGVIPHLTDGESASSYLNGEHLLNLV